MIRILSAFRSRGPVLERPPFFRAAGRRSGTEARERLGHLVGGHEVGSPARWGMVPPLGNGCGSVEKCADTNFSPAEDHRFHTAKNSIGTVRDKLDEGHLTSL